MYRPGWRELHNPLQIISETNWKQNDPMISQIECYVWHPGQLERERADNATNAQAPNKQATYHAYHVSLMCFLNHIIGYIQQQFVRHKIIRDVIEHNSVDDEW